MSHADWHPLGVYFQFSDGIPKLSTWDSPLGLEVGGLMFSSDKLRWTVLIC